MPEVDHARKMRGLRWLVASEGFVAVFHMTAMSTPLLLFLDELGFSKSQLGLFFSLFHLAGPLALVIAPAVERFGFKRTYITFLSTRKFVMCGMVLLPWIIAEAGFDFALVYATLVMGLYGLLRIVGETAMFPWMQEAIPNAVRGKFTAVATMVSTAVRLLTVMVGGWVIGEFTGLWRYQSLLVVGCFVGLVSVLSTLYVPGGAPGREKRSRVVHFQQMRQALRDGNLQRYLAGTALLVLGSHSWSTFAPLYLKDVIGLSQAEVVLLQSASMLGSFVFSYLWGYAADRYGSKRVVIVSIILLLCVPAGWLAMPVHSAWSLYWAVSIAVLSGVGSVAWGIGHSRQLYVNVVPRAKKTEYMALFYAAIELIRFTGPLASGLLLDYLQGDGVALTPGAGGNGGGPYHTYFALSMLLLALSAIPLTKMRSAPVDAE